MNELTSILAHYHKAPEIFQAGRYWKNYENQIIEEIKKADLTQMRSGKYPIFSTFGFGESVYYNQPNTPFYKKKLIQFIRKTILNKKWLLPYSVDITDIREMAYHHCILQGEIAGITPISEIEASSFGAPEDFFEINEKKYTMAFLNYYIRLCFFHRFAPLKGTETIVELGSGSGHQIEVLKKVFPNLTILCFDLPYNLYLGYEYLSNTIGKNQVVKPSNCLDITTLSSIEKGKVYMFGNWQFPLLTNFKFDIFWNAASFGEMEPHIVQNYLSYVLGNCNLIYLLQARHGKETLKNNGVITPIHFDDYVSMLSDYQLVQESDAFHAHRKLSDSLGYFQGLWSKQKK